MTIELRTAKRILFNTQGIMKNVIAINNLISLIIILVVDVLVYYEAKG